MPDYCQSFLRCAIEKGIAYSDPDFEVCDA